jgi:hypothetical protein
MGLRSESTPKALEGFSRGGQSLALLLCWSLLPCGIAMVPKSDCSLLPSDISLDFHPSRMLDPSQPLFVLPGTSPRVPA